MTNYERYDRTYSDALFLNLCEYLVRKGSKNLKRRLVSRLRFSLPRRLKVRLSREPLRFGVLARALLESIDDSLEVDRLNKIINRNLPSEQKLVEWFTVPRNKQNLSTAKKLLQEHFREWLRSLKDHADDFDAKINISEIEKILLLVLQGRIRPKDLEKALSQEMFTYTATKQKGKIVDVEPRDIPNDFER